MRFFAFLMLAATSLTSVGVRAQANPRIAVGRFSGPQGSAVRSALVSDLEENGVEVVEWSEVVAAAREETGSSRLRNDSDYVPVATALRLNAFITGSVRRARRSWGLRVVVRNGADGMRLGTERWSGRTVASLRSIRNSGYRRLQEHLAIANPPAPVAPPIPPQPDPAPAGGQPWYATGDGEVPEDPDDTDDDEDDNDDERSSALGNDGIRFSLDVGTLRRSMATDVVVDSLYRSPFPMPPEPEEPGTLITEERRYQSRGLGHLELGFTAEVFPGALMDDPVVPWLGLMFRFRNSVGLQSTGFPCRVVDEPLPPTESTRPRGDRCPDDEDTLIPIETTQRELYIGVRVDYDFSDDGRGPYFLLDAGYGVFQFRLEPDDLRLVDRLSIIPPVDYSYIHLGAGVRYYFNDIIGVMARASYRVGLGVGADALNIWGVQTKDTGGFTLGADLIGRLDRVARGLFMTVGLEFFRFKTRFRGQTACVATDSSDSCDGDELWEQWPEGGGIEDPVSDNYLRLNLSIGYAFH